MIKDKNTGKSIKCVNPVFIKTNKNTNTTVQMQKENVCLPWIFIKILNLMEILKSEWFT